MIVLLLCYCYCYSVIVKHYHDKVLLILLKECETGGTQISIIELQYGQIMLGFDYKLNWLLRFCIILQLDITYLCSTSELVECVSWKKPRTL